MPEKQQIQFNGADSEARIYLIKVNQWKLKRQFDFEQNHIFALCSCLKVGHNFKEAIVAFFPNQFYGFSLTN